MVHGTPLIFMLSVVCRYVAWSTCSRTALFSYHLLTLSTIARVTASWRCSHRISCHSLKDNSLVLSLHFLALIYSRLYIRRAAFKQASDFRRKYVVVLATRKKIVVRRDRPSEERLYLLVPVQAYVQALTGRTTRVRHHSSSPPTKKWSTEEHCTAWSSFLWMIDSMIESSGVVCLWQWRRVKQSKQEWCSGQHIGASVACLNDSCFLSWYSWLLFSMGLLTAILKVIELYGVIKCTKFLPNLIPIIYLWIFIRSRKKRRSSFQGCSDSWGCLTPTFLWEPGRFASAFALFSDE
jgi:hypothetical protein